MEQSRQWLWSRTKLGGIPRLPPLAAATAASTAAVSYHDSWEEQAFAEDSAGHLGGCVWPPRSYSCSFCRREFRSAQALGGHMNVHRRDRARLRLSSPTDRTESCRLHQQQRHHLPNPCSTPLATQCPLVNGDVPKACAEPPSAAAPPLSPSRVSMASSRKICSEHTLVSPSHDLSSLVKEDQKWPLFSITRLDSDPFSPQILTVPELKLGITKGGQKLKERDCEVKRDCCFLEEKEEEEVAIGAKRRRIDVAVPFIGLGSSPGGTSPLRSEVLGVGPTPIEELDLELRLGDRPKVK